MKNILFLTLLTFYFLSCEKSPYSYKDFEGDWKLETIPNYDPDLELQEIKDPFSPRIGLSFKKDSIEYFNGYFDEINNDSIRYIGNFSTYSIDKNHLKFHRGWYNKKPIDWEIIKVQQDTIFLKADNEHFYLKRIKFKKLEELDFDQIIYSTTSCYGTCPIFDISIDKSGNVLFYGEGYISPIGLQQAKANKNTTNFIFNKFARANPINLEDNYFSTVTDMSSYTTSYLKEGKIVKTIYDYGSIETPDELIWAYVPLKYLYQNVDLKKIHYLNQVPSFAELTPIKFVDSKNKNITLNKSEEFLLWLELIKSKILEISFSEKYKIETHNGYYFFGSNLEKKTNRTINTLTSDGRYYKFDMKDGNSKTYDLGYNFIERNFSESDSTLALVCNECQNYKAFATQN